MTLSYIFHKRGLERAQMWSQYTMQTEGTNTKYIHCNNYLEPKYKLTSAKHLNALFLKQAESLSNSWSLKGFPCKSKCSKKILGINHNWMNQT